ncbi:MAG: RNA methyltransferase [Firmicutes bacterium]|nr:RNA methyltransferase [Bacillota bacterium]
MMKQIKSSANDNFKFFERLYKRKYREREGCYVIEGFNLIEEAVKNGAVLRKIFVREDFIHDNKIIMLKNEGREIYSVPKELFDRTADTETPQGIAAICEKPKLSIPEFFSDAENIVVLDRLQDPGNIGTIIRTADAAGFGGAVVMKGTADLFSPKTVRAAAGSLYRVKLLFADDPGEVIRLLAENGIKSICTSPHGGELYFNADLAKNTALIIGNEASGACAEFLNGSDIKITLPMEGTIESLNAAVSASIVMYESLRQRYAEKHR